MSCEKVWAFLNVPNNSSIFFFKGLKEIENLEAGIKALDKAVSEASMRSTMNSVEINQKLRILNQNKGKVKLHL